MSKSIPSFKADLAFGKAAERDFASFYHEPVILSDDSRYDFRVIHSGDRLELKCDDWDHAKTPNFFLERYSDVHKETPGGPWRARKDRVQRFVYYFPNPGIYYEFTDVKALCTCVEKYVKKNRVQPIWIRNQAWFTSGYKIPRESLEHLYTVHTVGNTKCQQG